MGTASVRAALLPFFEAGVPAIQTMYKEAPWIIQGSAFVLNAGTTAGAVGFVHFDKVSERRIALPAYSGHKEVLYNTSLIFLYQYKKPAQLAAGVYQDDWVTELDVTFDQIKTLIRSDQTAGTGLGGAVFQMGDGEANNTPDITTEQDIPRDAGGSLYTLCKVTFSLIEIITA